MKPREMAGGATLLSNEPSTAGGLSAFLNMSGSMASSRARPTRETDANLGGAEGRCSN